MKTFKILIIIATMVFLTGCEITGPKIKVEGPKIKIPGVQVEDSGKFCPPGQAKKGRC